MTVATTTDLAEPKARFLNSLYDMTQLGADFDRRAGYVVFSRAAFRADLPDRGTLYDLVRTGLVLMRRGRDLAELDPAEASEADIINSLLSLTTAGGGWVEDNPRNALLRKVDASPLGQVTLRRALNVIPFGSGIRDLITEGYVSLHTAADHMEVVLRGRALHSAFAHHPDAYILLPTPKIRRVLGDRA